MKNKSDIVGIETDSAVSKRKERKISTTDNSSSGTFSHRNVLNKKDKKQNKTPHLQMKSGVELRP